jgi:hypothetical protein
MLFLVSLTLSLFLSSVVIFPNNSISYALSTIGGGGSKWGSFAAENPPSGFQRPNNGGGDNNLGAFSNIEHPPSSLNNGPPAALGGLQQEQQNKPLLNTPPSTNHIVNSNGCPTAVHPNGAGAKVNPAGNCSPPSSSSSATTTVIRPPPNNTPIDTKAIHANNNCAAVVHPNGADTKAVSSNNCSTNTNGHVTVNSGSTTASSSSSSPSLTVNNVQGSNNGASSSSSSSNINTNTIPIANAGPNQKVHTSDHVTLDGTKSSGPSSNSLKFSWLQLAGGPVISLSDQNMAKTTFVAPSVTTTTVLTFQLIVNNENAYSPPSYVTVTVQP